MGQSSINIHTAAEHDAAVGGMIVFLMVGNELCVC